MEDSDSIPEPRETKWDAVVLTCSDKAWTETLKQELDIRQKKGYIPEDVILLVVEDPKSNVGSGGATLNGLLTVVEYMSARKGFTVVNPDVLHGANILILHTGRSYSYDGCGRPFVTLPIKRDFPKFDGTVCNLDLIYTMVTKKLSCYAGPGVWVCSTDMLISIPEDVDFSSAFKNCDVCALSVPQSPKLLKDHGVYTLDTMGYVEDILFRADVSTLETVSRQDGNCTAAVGIVFMTNVVAEKILSFFTKPPLDACTYMGLDSGQVPLKLSLFFDFLLPMTNSVSEEDFVRGCRSGSYGMPASELPEDNRYNMEYARQMLWRALHNFLFKAFVIEGGKYVYMTDCATEHKKLLLSCPQTQGLGFSWDRNCHAYIEKSSFAYEESVIINSLLSADMSVGQRCAISHCDLQGSISIGKDSLLVGLEIDCSKKGKSLQIPDAMVVQNFHIHLKMLGITKSIFTVHGKHDNIKAPTWKSMACFCNQPWLVFLDRTGIVREDLWGTDVNNDNQTIYTAKLFPVFHTHKSVGLKEALWLMGANDDDTDKTLLRRWRESWRISLKDILSFVDIEAEFAWKRKVYYKIVELDLTKTLQTSGDRGFCSYFNSAGVENYSNYVLSVLDRVASETSSPGIAARTLANIADVLAGMAGVKGGLRSGPAGNVSWKKAFSHLEAKDFPKGVLSLAKEREKWMGRPDLLIRASRHYEGAAQILIRQAVMTAKQFFNVGEATLPRMNKWVQADCPARIDISGGWSDTPPITYEHGGMVAIVGLLINGKRPIGAKAKRLNEPILKLCIVNSGSPNTEVECRHLSDLEDYCHPHSPGALLKAAFVCIDLVDLHSTTSLAQQLMDKYGGGFEIHSWSNLPHGSGMGTSSILAGAVLATLMTVAGKSYDTDGLIHAVLYLEQLLTTGGGWQDQIGGLVGGVQLGVSKAELPLKVEVQELCISKENINKFNQRLILIYTGVTRLARNLLQDVLRNWYARNPYIVTTEHDLVALAKECATAFSDGDIELIGNCVARYWEMKKRLAPGCESLTISRILSVLKPYVHGICSAGAGGGGFVYGITNEPNMHQFLKELLAQQEDLEVVVYDACIDERGLTITIED